MENNKQKIINRKLIEYNKSKNNKSKKIINRKLIRNNKSKK